MALRQRRISLRLNSSWWVGSDFLAGEFVRAWRMQKGEYMTSDAIHSCISSLSWIILDNQPNEGLVEKAFESTIKSSGQFCLLYLQIDQMVLGYKMRSSQMFALNPESYQ
jgi:hypothetical protein